MLKPVRVTGPAALLTLTEAKAHLRVDHSDDDALIASLALAATDHFDGYSGTLGRCLVSQVWRQPFANWNASFRLPFTVVSTVTVTYQDETGTTQTVSAADYDVIEDHLSPLIVFSATYDFPELLDSEAPINVQFTTGFGTVDNVPEGLKVAVKLLLSHLYENRGGEAVVTPDAIDLLAAPYRLRRI